MQTPLDQAISEAAAAEGTYSADLVAVTNIQTSIAQATAPLQGALDQAVVDGRLAKAAYMGLAQAATDAANAIPEVPPINAPPEPVPQVG